LIGTGCLIFVMLLLATTSDLTSFAHAYELRTHGEITRQAYQSSLGLSSYLQAVGITESDTFDLASRTVPEKLAQFENTGTAQDWMIEGSIREDDFSKSIIGTIFGCVQPANPPSQIDRVFNHFLMCNEPAADSLSAPTWAFPPQIGRWDNRDAVRVRAKTNSPCSMPASISIDL
jgi:hypothetical protein